jgi:RHS repeat-associated protein
MQISGMLANLAQPEMDFKSLPYGDGFSQFQDQFADETYDDSSPLHFTGKEHDTESGNDYFGARYYASTMGRFLIPDWSAKVAPVPYAKLDNPQSLNLYTYVGNNPLAGVDPDGHFAASSSAGPNSSADSAEQREAFVMDSAENSSMNFGEQNYEQTVADEMRLFAPGVADGDGGDGDGGDGTQQQSEQQGINSQLKYKTVSGGQHSSSWEINWSLKHNTKKGGWIVQHIVADFEGSTQCGGHGQCNYWEAWPVAPNSHRPSIQGLDANGNSYSDIFGGGAGSHIHATATFYEGLTLRVPSLGIQKVFRLAYCVLQRQTQTFLPTMPRPQMSGGGEPLDLRRRRRYENAIS